MVFNVPAFDETYEIIGELNSGGGGIIYKAYHKRLNKYVIVKRIKNSIKGRIDVRGEADILKNLRHSYLPQVYDFIVVGNEYYTVIDYIDGVSLDAILKSGEQIPQNKVVKWARQLCEAVKYLHAQNPPIIHSDIKPANVMLTKSDDICLIDFNISLVFDGSVSAIGKSDGYSPPEQYIRSQRAGGVAAYGQQGSFPQQPSRINTSSQYSTGASGGYYRNIDNTIDERSDIYSIGATLYHMVTGVKPAISTTGAVVPLDNYPINIIDGLKYIIETAMSYNPAERFQTAEEMLAALNNISSLNKEYKKKNTAQIVAIIVVGVLVAFFSIVAVIGLKMIKNDDIEKYNELIESAWDCVDTGEYYAAIDDAVEAQSYCQDEVEPYYINAYAIYLMGDYEKCAEYIINNANRDFETDGNAEKEMEANINYLLGNCYFELGHYDDAADCFYDAIDIFDDNAGYYRDCAMALAKSGKSDESRKVIDKAESNGLYDDSFYIVDAEISAEQGDYYDAVDSYLQAARSGDDKVLMLRAYLAAAEISQNKNDDLYNAIDILEEARASELLSNDIVLIEKLGFAYATAASETDYQEYYDGAIECFGLVIDSGYSTYNTVYNLVVVYRAMGDHENSVYWLNQLVDDYPNRYEPYVQLALIEIDVQNAYSSSERDYSQAYTYYQTAYGLYQSAGSPYDSDMVQLSQLISDLQSYGYI